MPQFLFELNANHDTPELNSPELAEACVDRFLLAEAVSILTEPRGVRTDYHMLRAQWKEQLREALGLTFACLGEFTDYAGDGAELITLHYGTHA